MAGGACWAIVGADALAIEPNEVRVSRHELRIPGLGSGLDGVRLAQVTDVHFPGNVHAARVALDHLTRERPEIVVMTGDMTESAKGLPSLAAFAAAARGSLATVSTLGNWEYYGAVTGPAAETYRSAGAELLVNAARVVRVDGASLALVGLDDPVVGRPDVTRARAGLEPNDPELWLVHAPGFMSHPHAPALAAPAGVLAGHTHGGQIRLPFVPPLTPQGSGPYVAGWYRDAFAPLYVSRGIGTTMIPARFCCPPELAIFTLRRA